MIFAHGALGFLTTLALKRVWSAPRFGFTQKEGYLLLLLGFVAGIFPDVDLFYYYLVDASTYHRAFITHTPFFYLLFFGLCTGVSVFLKKSKMFIAGLVCTIGTFSHLLSDMVVSQIMPFFPFSRNFYGISDVGVTLINENLLFTNFFLEGVIFLLFFYLLIRLFVHDLVWRISLVTALLTIFTIGVATILYSNQYVYHAPLDTRYGDFDQDSVPNFEDRDSDGDGILNIDDLDADGDGKGNVEEIIENSERFFGVWVDPTDGGLLQIPARLGFVTNDDVVWRLFETVGIHIQQELQADYALNSNGYVTSPKDENFDRRAENIRAWLQHREKLADEIPIERFFIGDILFFENGYVTVVIGFTNEGQPLVLDIQNGRTTAERLLTTIVDLEGSVDARGSVLDPQPLFGD